MRCAYCGSEDVEYAGILTDTPTARKDIGQIQVECQDCQAVYTTNKAGTIISRYNRSLGIMGVYIKEDLTPQEIKKICYEMRLINEGDEGGEE